MKTTLLKACILLFLTCFTSIAQAKTLILFVHGFGGNAVIDRLIEKADREHGDIERASMGEFNALYDSFREQILERGLSEEFGFASFKFDTKKNTNYEAAEVLHNIILSRHIPSPATPYNNVLPEGFTAANISRVHIVTLSNGNLVVRKSILNALSEKNLELIGFFSKASVYDISPILGGAADARGTLGIAGRYREIDPFGQEMGHVFSDDAILKYNSTIQDRHFTFLICGDPYTRGIWNSFLDIKRRPFYEKFLRLSTFIQGKSWKKRNLKWFSRFEKARGKDSEHHFEYVPELADKSYCSRQEYLEGLDSYLEHDTGGNTAFDQRRSMKSDQYFLRSMSSDLGAFTLDHFNEVYGPDEKTHQKFYSGVGDTGLRSLGERHTMLVYYKPVIELIGEKIFWTP